MGIRAAPILRRVRDAFLPHQDAPDYVRLIYGQSRPRPWTTTTFDSNEFSIHLDNDTKRRFLFTKIVSKIEIDGQFTLYHHIHTTQNATPDNTRLKGKGRCSRRRR